ncbi:Dipeptidyl aminopeptidase, partial [Physocladia obscura]
MPRYNGFMPGSNKAEENNSLLLITFVHVTHCKKSVTNQIMNRTKPYGRFASVISTEGLVASSIGIPGLVKDKARSALFHIENRPSEKGRAALVSHFGGNLRELSALSTYSLRTGVHEYGGAPVTVNKGVFVFADSSDRRVFVLRRDTYADPDVGPSAEPVTPDDETTRYADFAIDPSELSRFAAAIQEIHHADGRVVNNLVAIDISQASALTPALPTVLAQGRDFYTAPRFSPDGGFLAWIEWDLPEMPWTKSSLHVATWDAQAGAISESRVVAEGDFSVSQPVWHPTSGELYFANDQTGYYNLYRYNLETGVTSPLLKDAFVGDFSSPDWTLGQHTYDFLTNGSVVAGHSNKDGTGAVSIIDPVAQTIELLVSGPIVQSLVTIGDRIYIVAGTPVSPISLSEVVIEDANKVSIKIVKNSTNEFDHLDIDAYAPKNPDHAPPSDSDLPPVVVLCHGGPTAASTPILSSRIQWWTSRGFAIFDVNYGGSSGYGRDYRSRLDGKWGIVDVDDVCNGAQYLAKIGKVDGNKLCVTGGSAGGFTTLSVLTFRPDVFACGASKFGISDLKSLSEFTHKFESKYLDIVLGTRNLSEEETLEVYRTRSPINYVDNIVSPLLVLQGSIDKVVPPDQAESIVSAIKAKGGVVEYVLFEDEGHGWRTAETIKRAVEIEYEFYLKIKINRLAPDGVNMYVKIESQNPLGSVKDRLALGVIEDAERRGVLKPGMTVVEATSGNTGIALAMVCAAKGYPFVAVMIETFSIERRKIMKFLGAKVVLTPKELKGTGMVEKAAALAKEHGWFESKQFANPANPAYHRQTTGPEILQSFAGKRLDYIVSGWGTGGT